MARAIRLWLYAVAALVLAMVLVGGATRLTESGLSITEWQPVMGTLPPLSETQWQAEFEKYQAIPQYRELNRGMSLDAFKTIYWWEWTHRLIGRTIGVAFLLPFLWFLWRGWIGPGLRDAALADFRARRAARRGRLVDGRLRLGRSRRSLAISAGDASRARLRDLCRAAMDGAAAGSSEPSIADAALASAPARSGFSFWCWRRSISARWSPDCAPATSTIPGR